jgi:hypothetical protein
VLDVQLPGCLSKNSCSSSDSSPTALGAKCCTIDCSGEGHMVRARHASDGETLGSPKKKSTLIAQLQMSGSEHLVPAIMAAINGEICFRVSMLNHCQQAKSEYTKLHRKFVP